MSPEGRSSSGSGWRWPAVLAALALVAFVITLLVLDLSQDKGSEPTASRGPRPAAEATSHEQAERPPSRSRLWNSVLAPPRTLRIGRRQANTPLQEALLDDSTREQAANTHNKITGLLSNVGADGDINRCMTEVDAAVGFDITLRFRADVKDGQVTVTGATLVDSTAPLPATAVACLEEVYSGTHRADLSPVDGYLSSLSTDFDIRVGFQPAAEASGGVAAQGAE